MKLSYALAAIRRYLIGIVLMGLVGAVLGLAYGSVRTSYETTAAFSISPQDDGYTQSLYIAGPERFVRSELQTMLSDEVVGGAAVRLDPPLPIAEVWSSVQVTGGEVDNVFELHTRAASPEFSQALSTAMLEEFAARTQAQTEVLRVGPPLSSGSVIRSTALGAAGGLAVGVVLVLVWVAARRPVLGVGCLTDSLSRLPHEVRVYPDELRLDGADEPNREELSDVLRWLRNLSRGAEPSSPVIAVAGVGRLGPSLARTVQDRLARLSEDSGAGVTLSSWSSHDEVAHAVLVVASDAGNTEWEIERRTQSVGEVVPAVGVLVVEGGSAVREESRP